MEAQIIKTQGSELQKYRTLNKHFLNSIKKSAKESFSNEEIQIVYKGWKNPVRRLENANGEIFKYTLQAAKVFGSRKDVEKDVLKACARLVTEHFKKIGAHEIYLAFEWKAAGLLDVNAEMWGGSFNADILGKVLTAYVKRRNELIAAFIEEEHKVTAEQEEKEREQKRKDEYNYLVENFEKIYKEKGFTSWREVPEFYYQIAKKKGLLRFKKGEGHEILAEAEKIAKEDLRKQYIEVKNSTNNQIALHELMHKMKLTTDENTAKAYARKISVFRKLKNL